MVLVAAMISLPFYLTSLMRQEDMEGLAYMLRQSLYDFPADLLSWALPPAWNPFWGKYTAATYAGFTTANLAETSLFFGFLPPVLALATAFMRWPENRQVRYWQAVGLLAFIMSFGPVLHVGGQQVLQWMPYRLFMALPGSESFRIPSRVGVAAILAGTVLAMMLLSRLLVGRNDWKWKVLLGIGACACYST